MYGTADMEASTHISFSYHILELFTCMCVVYVLIVTTDMARCEVKRTSLDLRFVLHSILDMRCIQVLKNAFTCAYYQPQPYSTVPEE